MARVISGKVSFANEVCPVPCSAKYSRKALFGYIFVEVDAIVVYAVSQRQQSGQDGCAGWLANDVRCYAGGEAGSLPCQQVEVWSVNWSSFETVGIAPVLVAGDEKDVRPGMASSVHMVALRFCGDVTVSTGDEGRRA